MPLHPFRRPLRMGLQNFPPLQRRVVQQPVGRLGLRIPPARYRNTSRRLRRERFHQPDQSLPPPRVSKLHSPSSQSTQLIINPQILYILQYVKSCGESGAFQPSDRNRCEPLSMRQDTPANRAMLFPRGNGKYGFNKQAMVFGSDDANRLLSSGQQRLYPHRSSRSA